MYKISVYTLVNGNIKELAHRKQQKSQKMISFSSTLTVKTHSQWMRAILPFVIFAVFDVQVL